MNAKEYFGKQLITDTKSVIDPYKSFYNTLDVCRFAEEYHKAKLESLGFIDISKLDKTNVLRNVNTINVSYKEYTELREFYENGINKLNKK